MTATALVADRVLTPEGPIGPAALLVEDGVITAVTDAARLDATVERVDLGDVDLWPGLVDVHCDSLEGLVHPRPGVELPVEAALLELDGTVLAHGITTPHLCVSLEEDATRHRSLAAATRTIDAFATVRAHLRADWRIHLRVDVTGPAAVRRAGELAGRDEVTMVSYMDHTPGQGQYADAATWRAFYRTSEQGDLDARLRRKLTHAHLVESHREAVAGVAHAGGAVLAAHDDDGPETVARSVGLGAAISEFPVTEAAARAARDAGQGIVMGAPNARRGGSHVDNLSARDAIAAGLCDALASDYHPPSMLAAAYLLAEAGLCSWATASRLVCGGPARLAALPNRGALTTGRRADVVAVARRAGNPVVVQSWVAGDAALGHRARAGAGAGAR